MPSPGVLPASPVGLLVPARTFARSAFPPPFLSCLRASCSSSAALAQAWRVLHLCYFAMGSPHWPAVALPAPPGPAPAATCAYCGRARIPATLNTRVDSIAGVPFAYGRRACATCRDTPPAILEQYRLTLWLTFTRTIQRDGPCQRILTGPLGRDVGRCLCSILPTHGISRAFLDSGSGMDADRRCLGSLLPHTQRNPWMLGGGPLHGHPMVHIHPSYAAALNSGAPLLVLGDYLKTIEHASSHRSSLVCRAYSAPPDVCHHTHEVIGGGTHLATLQPGTYIGPIEEFCVSVRFVTVLVRRYWINVWMRRSTTSRGTYLALPVRRSEVRNWQTHGWVDRS